MKSFGNFLWKLFSVTMVFLCHIGSNAAIAEEQEPTKYVANDPKMTSNYFTSSSEVNSGYTRTIQLCPSGQYLAGCGIANLGTNWLKGMTKPGGIKTPDYYSYDTESSDTIHMENLGKFFAHTQPITYRARTSSSNTYTYSDITVQAATYKPHLYQILSNFCTDDQGYISDDVTHCEKCPNNAYVKRSTVKEDTYDTGKILWDSWDVHTIADCYMNEFSDENGTYVYVAENVQDSTTGVNCYYTKNTPGTLLYYK